MKRIILLSIILICSLAGFAQSTVTVSVTENNRPEVSYKRGIAAPGMNGFFNSTDMRDFIDYQSSIGMNIFNGIRNLFKDPETNEFYQEDGIYKNQQIAKFTDIRKYAENAGFELISQVGGTPQNSGYEFDTTYRKSPDPASFKIDGDFAPLPKEGQSMQEFQRNFTEWAINADKAVAPDFHSIWIGTQEIAHTIGFEDGIVNDDTKKLNIRRWVDYWKPISDQLRAAGAKTGGIQLNSSNADIYGYAVDYMIEKDLCMDYLTYQFYQWGDTADLAAAVDATKRYAATYPGTKLIVDRGGYSKLLPAGVDPEASSQGCVQFLVGELGLMNHADIVYAYSLDRSVNGMDQAKSTLLWLTKTWINQTGSTRCAITGTPAGVDGFAVRSDTKLSIALWNNGIGTQALNLSVNSFTDGHTALVWPKHARGNSFIPSPIQWDSENQLIKGIVLNQYDFVLIDVELTGVTAISHPKTTSSEIEVFPNPAESCINIKSGSSANSMSLFSLAGHLVKTKKNCSSLMVDDVLPGTYLLMVDAGKGQTCTKVIIQ